MPDGLVTSRQLQNEATGIDLQVPLYQEIRGAMMTGHVEYQIVVVTRLAAFKSPKHRPGDVVQLVVSKKYSEIDDFYNRLMGQYPKISLPAMPRKALFVGEAEIKERRAAFDQLLKFLSKNPTLATCSELLEFLGAKTTDVADYKIRNVPDWEEDEDELDFFRKDEAPIVKRLVSAKAVKQPTQLGKPPNPTEGKDEDEEEEEMLDPLGIMKSTKRKQKSPAEPRPAVKPSAPALLLFDEEADSDGDLFEPAARPGAAQRAVPAKESPLKLFEDPDLGGTVKSGDSLLLPTPYVNPEPRVAQGLDEDMDELFRVEEDLDKLLTVSKVVKPKPEPAPKPKPPPKPKPALPEKPSSLSSKGVAPAAGPGPEAKAQTMNQMDILQYIQQNQPSADDDLDLF